MKQRSRKFSAAIAILALSASLAACGFGDRAFEYHGTIDPADHAHLGGKRVFIDPGGSTFAGPSGLREDEVNLKVAKALRSILTRAGAKVELSRTRDRNVEHSEKAKSAGKFAPDLIVVIRHAAGNPSAGGKNHPAVIIRGGRDGNPQSYDLARILLGEFDKSFDAKGLIVGDEGDPADENLFFTAKPLCPEVAGRFGYLGDPDSESLLRDTGFNVAEAERYFTAISEYFRRGIPSASLMTDENLPAGRDIPVFKSNAPLLAVRLESGIKKEGPAGGTVSATLNGRIIATKRIDDRTYQAEYGKTLMPGRHIISFSFRNGCYQSSPVYRTAFIIPFKDDGYAKSVAEGKRLVSAGKYGRGLDLLIPAFNSERDDRDADSAVFAIARAFDALGDRKNAGKYYSLLYNSYPQSPLREKVPGAYRNSVRDDGSFSRDAEWIAWDLKR